MQAFYPGNADLIIPKKPDTSVDCYLQIANNGHISLLRQDQTPYHPETKSFDIT